MNRLAVPGFLEADSKKELVQMMNAVQFRVQATVHFFDFQKDGKKYVCWFQLPVGKQREIDG